MGTWGRFLLLTFVEQWGFYRKRVLRYRKTARQKTNSDKIVTPLAQALVEKKTSVMLT